MSQNIQATREQDTQGSALAFCLFDEQHVASTHAKYTLCASYGWIQRRRKCQLSFLSMYFHTRKPFLPKGLVRSADDLRKYCRRKCAVLGGLHDNFHGALLTHGRETRSCIAKARAAFAQSQYCLPNTKKREVQTDQGVLSFRIYSAKVRGRKSRSAQPVNPSSGSPPFGG